MRYGIVYFDSAVERGRVGSRNKDAYVQAREGWASIAGTAAFRIDHLAELPSDVVWITNLDFNSYLKNNMGGSPNFVPYYYLKTDIGQIAAEIGAHIEHERINVIVECLANVFARTMRLAEQQYGIRGIGIGAGKKKLEHAVASAIGRGNTPTLDASLNKAMEQAFQRRNKVIGQTIPREWWQCTLRRNRYEHAHDTLSVRVPSNNNWEYLDASRLPSAKQRVDWAIHNELPTAVQVTVADGRGLGAVLTSFGNKGHTTIAREWVSAPELCWLARYYSVHIEAAFVCNDGYRPQPEIERFPAANEFCLASLSMGLLVENFFSVLMEPPVNQMNASIYVPSCVWYSAVDRFIMFLLAYRIVKASGFGDPNAGFKIHSYGFGNIQVCTPHDKVDELTDLAAGLGLEVPSSAYWKRTMQHRMLQTEQVGA